MNKKELRLDENKMKEIIEKYDREYENFEGIVTAGCSMVIVGYGMGEHAVRTRILEVLLLMLKKKV